MENLESLRKILDDSASLSGLLDEPNTKQSIITPILRSLQWNVNDYQEVQLELPVGKGKDKVDYGLKINEEIKVIIEAKRIGERLNNCEKQILNYSKSVQNAICVLTNGIEWYFYFRLKKDDIPIKFLDVNLKKDDRNIIAHHLMSFVSKYAISNLSYLKYIEDLISSDPAPYIRNQLMVKGWNKIVADCHPSLIQLLADVILENYNKKLTADDINEFIKCHVNPVNQIIDTHKMSDKVPIKMLGLQHKVLQMVVKRGTISHSDLMRNVVRYMNATMLNSVIETLVSAKLILVDITSHKGKVYRSNVGKLESHFEL